MANYELSIKKNGLGEYLVRRVYEEGSIYDTPFKTFEEARECFYGIKKALKDDELRAHVVEDVTPGPETKSPREALVEKQYQRLLANNSIELMHYSDEISFILDEYEAGNVSRKELIFYSATVILDAMKEGV